MPRAEISVKSSRFFMLASIGVVVAGLYLAQDFLVPLALAVLFSFLLSPLVRYLEKAKLPRIAAVLITVALAFSVLAGIGYIVGNQLTDLSHHMEEYRKNISDKMQSLRSREGLFAQVKKGVEEASKIASSQPATQPQSGTGLPVYVTNSGANSNSNGSGGEALTIIREWSARILGPVGTSFIVIVFTIFMLLQREDLRDRLIRLVGRSQLTVTTQALNDAAERVSRYLLMQTIINGSVGVIVMAALWSVGKFNGQSFPSPALWGLLAALLRFIPYVGIWISAAMPVFLSLAVFSSAKVAFETLGCYIAIELIAANVMEPLLFGSSTGIATLAVLVAAAFWTWLWGPVGLLLSTPLTVCLVVIGKYVPQLEFLTILLGDEPALSPPARVYQRLLALEQEEATELVHEYAEKMPLEELYDSVLLPALTMAEWDHHRENLDDDRITAIREALRDIVDEIGDQHRAAVAAAAQEAAKTDIPGNASVAVPAAAAKLPAHRPLAAAPGTRIMLPKNCTVQVVCLPASNLADEVSAMMFSQLLEARNYCVAVVSVEQLASEMIATVERLKADVVCVSAMPPAAVTHARYLCKRLHGKFTDIAMVVGLWTAKGDLKRSKQRIACAESVPMSGSFAEALDQVHQLIQHKLIPAESTVVAAV